MNTDKFIKRAKELVADYVKKEIEPKPDAILVKINGEDVTKEQLSSFDINNTHLVWNSKILRNYKAVFIVILPDMSVTDGGYYEVTYNGDKEEFYLDAYFKVANEKHKL